MPDKMVTAKQQLKNLLRECERNLSFPDDGSFIHTQFIRHPRVPLVNIIWGRDAESTEQIVSDVFESSWMSGAAFDDLIGFVRGSSSSGDLVSSVRNSVVSLLKSDGIPDKSAFFFAHYLNILSPEYECELASACDLRNRLNDIIHNAFVLFFFICDDHDVTNQALIRQRINSAEEMLKTHSHYFGFYLGNFLSDGTLIKSAETGENYRVAADIAMLVTTLQDEVHRIPQDITPWLLENSEGSFTAAYTRMQKPSLDIVRVTMESIVKHRSDISKENDRELKSRTAAASATLFWSSMEEKATQITAVEDAFKEYIVPNLPRPQAFEYLPNWKKASKETDYLSANEKTDGFLKLFVDEKFSGAVNEMDFDCSVIADRFIAQLMTRCDYGFIKDSFRQCADYIDYIKPPKQGGIYQRALSEAKIRFYDIVKPALKAAMIKQAEKAEAFSDLMGECLKALSAPPLPTATGLIPVDEFYSAQAKALLSSEGETLKNLLEISDDPDKMINGLKKVFDLIVARKPEVYRCPLEDELDNRLKERDNTQNTLVSVALDDERIDSRQRIRATGYGPSKQDFYIYYGAARFGSSLKKGCKFVTGAKNSAERLIINTFSAESLL